MSSKVAFPIGLNETTKFQSEFNGIVPKQEEKEVKTYDEEEDDEAGWFSWIRWRPRSEKALRESETTMLSSTLSRAYSSFFVNIGPVVGKEDCKIWTISLNTESTEVPLVLVHGFAAGVGFWCLNMDSLAATRPVFAIDLLGFGRSSRPKFSDEPEEAEAEFVKSIEAWRQAMGLEKIILLGHSLGGYLAASFSITFPDSVESLILADPWGFKDRPLEIRRRDGTEVPAILRLLIRLFEPMNPLSSIRLLGPWGPYILSRIRADIIARFEPHVKDASRTVATYLYQCNAKDPSGESAFHSMMSSFFWAKNPMHHRLHLLDKKLPITLIFGERSWVEALSAEKVVERRGGDANNVKSHVIEDASHHVYADKRDLFNHIVQTACQTLKQDF